jgi:DHHC palmitoyltransferase
MYSKNNSFWKCLYFFPVLIVYFIITINIYTFTAYYSFNFPLKITFGKIFISLIFYFCAFMTIITHTLSMVTHPGWVNKEKLQSELDKKKLKEVSFCKKCEMNRPFKAHHCSTCQTCILKMDHHCPWIANCVGFFNQKYFYQFLFYATVGDFFGAIGLFTRIIDPDFMTFINKPNRRINLKNNLIFEIIAVLKDPLLIILGFGMTLAMSLAIGFLFFYQTYLIFNDSSSIEDTAANSHKCNDKDCQHKQKDDKNAEKSVNNKQKNSKEKSNSKNDQKGEEKNKIRGYLVKIKNIFERKNLENFKIILGMDSYLEWFMPIFKPNELNNGYNYPNSD